MKISFCYDIANNECLAAYYGYHHDIADNRILDERSEITIRFEYPLRHPVERVFTTDNGFGFTRKTFAEAIALGYATIYAEEDASRTLSPEPRGMLLNRSATDGVHGIWGHGIGDLVLEGAYLDGEIWCLGVGS